MSVKVVLDVNDVRLKKYIALAYFYNRGTRSRLIRQFKGRYGFYVEYLTCHC